MLFLNVFVQIIIVFGAICLFIVLFIINKKIQAPKGIEMPEKCLNCQSSSCLIKTTTIAEYKKELKEELERCSEKDE